MLNFGASKPRVRGARAPGAPPGSAPALVQVKFVLKQVAQDEIPVPFSHLN